MTSASAQPPSAKLTLPADKITIVLTSCGRWDLLTQSIDSFLSHHQPGRFILVEDSGNHAFADRVRERYPQIEVLLNEPRLGQHKSIDKAYAEVRTPWILHLEDDWLFTGAIDLQGAWALLQSDRSVVAVCFALYRGQKITHRVFGRRFRHEGRDYGDLRRAHRESYGFSFYPTLVARRVWEEHGPYSKFPNEREISKHMKALGLGVVHRLPGIAMHMGSGRSVFDPARAGERRRVRGGFLRRLRGKGTYAPIEE